MSVTSILLGFIQIYLLSSLFIACNESQFSSGQTSIVKTKSEPEPEPEPEREPEPEPCKPTVSQSGDSRVISVTYRDFRDQHPDFESFSGHQKGLVKNSCACLRSFTLSKWGNDAREL